MENPMQQEKEPVNLEKVLDDIESVCEPVSIFLYGSRARTDSTSFSDYEIGVLIPEDRYVGRSVVRGAVKDSRVSVYPFRLEQFQAGNPDTPFNKKIYMRELIASGKTLRGKRIIEEMQLPSIEVLDALSDAQFNLGYALAATIAHRDGSEQTANLLFYKSCLFGTRALVIEKTGKVPATYDDILKEAEKLDLGEYTNLVKAAYESRQTGKYDPQLLFKNISYINQLVVPNLSSRLKDGNAVLVE
ncbi:MAG: hypothetical protein A3J46_00255 [Candidatus Yanofskybacteria bacterium RIFCSPHIGHO2_02_FULL_41_11]|uniref:Polymerase nucleotidyl transferase domain-containing protein n=1 Tax=Candidatus Yanofskybacteria bacterium RIFCSPHIGHO2_02_FULL_41_11 TaxID=1802675 RepID=A0A1F8F8W6_9BACT|nr:MAG: hypothetical protein A3J46_00255 [Candidatus Yanofskybacteria bacterium RIFCSPHIGHO2_02_FULL_41_11]